MAGIIVLLIVMWCLLVAKNRQYHVAGVLGFVSGLNNLIGKMGGHWSLRIELNSK